MCTGVRLGADEGPARFGGSGSAIGLFAGVRVGGEAGLQATPIPDVRMSMINMENKGRKASFDMATP